MDKKRYRRYDPDQGFLLPPSLREWLRKDHFVSDVIDQMDPTAMEAVCGDELRGQQPHHPCTAAAWEIQFAATGEAVGGGCGFRVLAPQRAGLRTIYEPMLSRLLECRMRCAIEL
jgi:hypothetical protein